MKQRHYWLLALLSILTLLMTTTLATAGEATASGHVETGISVMDVNDNPARVNEYVKTSSDSDNAINPAIDLGVDFSDEGVAAEIEGNFQGSDNYDFSTKADINRVFRFNLGYQSLQHWKDHETLSQMGATARDDLGGAQPNVTTDKIYADMIAAGTPVPSIGGTTLADPAQPAVNTYDPAAAWEQEVSNDYLITRRELKSEVDLALPMLPNIVFHAGLRVETRDGMEQAIGLSKCTGCHVSAKGKNIDERTEEFTLGATGKFGIVTVDYEYLTRDFDEQAAAPSRWYVNSGGLGTPGFVKGGNLLYGTDNFEFAKTPDSKKDSHLLKARVDVTSTTSITASYVNADVESTKTDEAGIFELDDKTLTSEYNGYNGKVATAFGPIHLSFRGGYYEIDGPEYSVTFDKRNQAPNNPPTTSHTMSNTEEYTSAESREVTEFGVDAVYRLARATTLRLGYEYEDVQRDEAELGETETHTLKAAIKSRFGNTLSGRISYEYQNITDPFVAHKATGIAQGQPGAITDPFGSGLVYLDTAQFANTNGNSSWVYYWNSVYPSRGFDATNQPEDVHEGKLSTTWSPSANMAATFFLRARYEENGDVHYEQTTFVPGVSFWYAPSDKVNLTMSYTFNNQDTENRACVGWYHG